MKIELIIIGLIGLFFNYGLAQDRLSLSDAIRLGLDRNYDIRIEEKNVLTSETNNNWGEAGLFPSLTASLQGSTSVFDNKEALNPFSIVAKTKTTSQIVPSLNLNWNLLGVKNISINKHKFETLQKESEGNADIVIANNIQSIILGYYVVVLELRRLEEFKKQLELSRDKYHQIKLRKDMGSAVTSDLLLEEGNYLTDSADYIIQERVFKNAQYSLNFLIGETEINKGYILTDDFIIDKEGPLTYEQLARKMDDDNIDLKKQYLSQAILNDDVQLRRADRLPQLSIGANYTYTKNTQDISDWPIERLQIRDDNGNVIGMRSSTGTNANANYGANFTVSFNLFNGGKINRAIQRTIILEDIGNIRIEKMKSSMNRDLLNAFEEYQVRKQLFEISDLRYISASQNLEITEHKFENGSINSFDYRTVQNNHLMAAIQRLQSLYNLIDSKVTLMRLTGGIVATYRE